MPIMKFLLTSSGLSNISIEQALLGLVGKAAHQISVVFVPTAANLVEDDKSWLVRNYADFLKLGLRSFDIVDIAAMPRENWYKRFEAADVLCFGGGDEQYLAKVMRESGVAAALPELLKTRVYMGISAGSMVVGRLLPSELTHKLWPEESFAGAEAGLGILDLSILPHLNSDYFAHLRVELIRSLAPRFPVTVYALDDTSAVQVIGSRFQVVTEGVFLTLEK